MGGGGARVAVTPALHPQCGAARRGAGVRPEGCDVRTAEDHPTSVAELRTRLLPRPVFEAGAGGQNGRARPQSRLQQKDLQVLRNLITHAAHSIDDQGVNTVGDGSGGCAMN